MNLKLVSKFSIVLFFAYLSACGQIKENPKNNGNTSDIIKAISTNILSNPSAKTIITRFSVPKGYERQTYQQNSFQYYLTNFPLQDISAKVYYFNGKEKENDVCVSVFDIDVGKKDLQQCADAIMRLRAEYLYAQKEYKKIHFNFVNGFNAEYDKWAQGNRVKIVKNTTNWYKLAPAKGNKNQEDYSYKTFSAYLELVYSYAGTLSLAKEMKKIALENLEIGDVFIKGGSPGHAVIVVDMAINKNTGNKIFMIAQSYMPAQSIHLLINANDKNNSPWYDLSDMDKLYSPEWTFEKTDLKRFETDTK